MTRSILVTGAAGFIGFHLARKLVSRDVGDVSGVDNLNDYYDVSLKEARLGELEAYDSFDFARLDVSDRERVEELFERSDFDCVVHLAAQAGVRYSVEHPHAYLESNLAGFLNILEGCRHTEVDHLVYASSSSVYGANEEIPYSEHHATDHPLSLYGATKRSNELMAHAYANLYGLPVTGLRFFTVYGPWGRPDMAYFLFVDAIENGETIDVYNHGDMMRDFTFVDDVVDGVLKVMERPPEKRESWTGTQSDPSASKGPFAIYNIGNSQPVDLMEFIGIIEDEMGEKVEKNFMPMQPGDAHTTYADCSDLEEKFDYTPDTPLEEGIEAFVRWYKEVYRRK